MACTALPMARFTVSTRPSLREHLTLAVAVPPPGTLHHCAVVLEGRFRNRPEIVLAGCALVCGPPLTVRCAPVFSLFFCRSPVVVPSVDIRPAYHHYVKHREQSYKSMSESRVYVARPSPSCAPHDSCQEHPAEYCGIHKTAAGGATERACSQEGAGPFKSADWLMRRGHPAC